MLLHDIVFITNFFLVLSCHLFFVQRTAGSGSDSDSQDSPKPARRRLDLSSRDSDVEIDIDTGNRRTPKSGAGAAEDAADASDGSGFSEKKFAEFEAHRAELESCNAEKMARQRCLDFWQPGPSFDNHLRETNAFSNLTDFYGTTGRGRGQRPDGAAPDFRNDGEAIPVFGPVITPDIAQRHVAAATSRLDPLQRIFGCASCGVRTPAGRYNTRTRETNLLDACMRIFVVSAVVLAAYQTLQVEMGGFEMHTVTHPNWKAIDASNARKIIGASTVYAKTSGHDRSLDPNYVRSFLLPQHVAVTGTTMAEQPFDSETRPKAFFLHSKFVNPSTGNVTLCKNCHSYIMRTDDTNISRIPPNSVLAGFDYGNTDHMEKLTSTEVMVIAIHRQLTTTKLKIVANGTSRLSGSVCLVEQTGPHSLAAQALAFERAARAVDADAAALPPEPEAPLDPQEPPSPCVSLPRLCLSKDIFDASFVGTEEDWKKATARLAKATDVPGSMTALLQHLAPVLAVRARVVFAWLAVLKLTHPDYADVVILDQKDQRVLLALDAIPLQILQETSVISDSVSLRLQSLVGNDITGRRDLDCHDADAHDSPSLAPQSPAAPASAAAPSPVVQPEGDSSAPVAAPAPPAVPSEAPITAAVDTGPLEGTIIMDASFIFDAPQTSSSNSTFLQSVQRSLVRVHRTSNQPVNEFLLKADTITRAFPHLFIFGSAGFPDENFFTTKRSSHLLTQASNRFIDERLIFLFGNIIQRHAACRVIGIKALAKPESLAAFKVIVTAPGFKERLQAAIADIKSDDAKALVAQLCPFIRQCAAEIPFSAELRGAVLSRQIALMQLFGTPSWFITVSPTDANSALVLRFCKPVEGYQQPTTLDGDKPHDYSADPDFIHGPTIEFRMPDQADRLRAVSDNPAASAAYYGMVVDALFKHLLQLPQSHRTRRSVLPGCYRNYKNDTEPGRNIGIFGESLAYMGVTEVSFSLCLK